MKRTFTPLCRPGVTLGPITGTVHTLFGVPMVAHKEGKTWSLSEPLTGRSVQQHGYTRDALIRDATARIELVGGPCALGSIMAGVVPRLKSCQLHAPEFVYGAGGPLDAPELINTGCTRFSPYSHRHFSEPVTAHAFQIEIPR